MRTLAVGRRFRKQAFFSIFFLGLMVLCLSGAKAQQLCTCSLRLGQMTDFACTGLTPCGPGTQWRCFTIGETDTCETLVQREGRQRRHLCTDQRGLCQRALSYSWTATKTGGVGSVTPVAGTNITKIFQVCLVRPVDFDLEVAVTNTCKCVDVGNGQQIGDLATCPEKKTRKWKVK